MKKIKIAIILFLSSVLNSYGQTTLISTIDPNYTQHLSTGGIEMNGILYYIAANSTSGSELWRTDGTPSGTYMVKDINPGYPGAFASEFLLGAVYQGKLYFTARDFSHGYELWRTDGTANGTQLFYDLNPGPGDASIGSFVTTNNRLLFIRLIGNTNELYASNGTVAGTSSIYSFEVIYDIFSLGNNAVMSAREVGGSTGTDLWRTNGTPNGTFLLKDINPLGGNSFPSHFTKFNNWVMFDAYTDANGAELWRSDGTSGGTIMIKDIFLGNNDGLGGFYGPPIGIQHGSYFYFGANDGVKGLELWRTNGTAGDATRLSDIKTGSASSLQLNNGIHIKGSEVVFRVDGFNRCVSFDTLTGRINKTNFRNAYNMGMVFYDGVQYYSFQDSLYGDEFRRNDGSGEKKIQESILFNNYQPFYTNGNFRMMGKLGNKILYRYSDWEGTKYRSYVPVSNTCFAPEISRNCWINSTRSDIIWNRIPDVSNYQIAYKLISDTNWTIKTTSVSFSNLAPLTNGETYEYRIRANCGNGYTPWSDVKSFIHQQVDNFYNATLIAERNISATEEVIYWNKNISTNRAQIRYRPFNTTTWSSTIVAFSPRQVITGLQPNTFYEYEIRGFAGGWDTWRRHYFTTTPDKIFRTGLSNEQQVASNIIKLAPNPVNPMSTLQINSETSLNDCQIIVTDMLGKIILQENSSNLEDEKLIQIQTGDWKEGIYFISIFNSNGNKVASEKFVVN